MKKVLLWMMCLLGMQTVWADTTIWSADFALDCTGPLIATGVVRVSPVAERENANAKLLVDGQEASGWTRQNPLWDSTTVADGRHFLSLSGEMACVWLEVFNGTLGVIHEGVLAANETWTADRRHIVPHVVVIPEGRTLTIADGATVHFCAEAGFVGDGTVSWGKDIHLVLEGDIPADAFAGVEGISSVTLADSVTSIGDSAFAGCINLEEIVLSRNLATIGENAFQRCAKLTRLHFPEGAVTTGAGAFSGCTRLKEITFAGHKPNYLGTGRLFPHREAAITAYSGWWELKDNGSYQWQEWENVYGWSADPLYQVNVERVDFPVCGDFTYQIDCKEEAWIRSWDANASELVVPAVLDGHPVRRLRNAALRKSFLYRKDVVKLTLPATVEELEDGFARECNRLAHVIFAGERPPAMVAGNHLFPDCNPHLLVPETAAWTAAIEEGWKCHQEAISYHVDELGYRVEADGSATVTTYCRDEAALVIPPVLNGHPVKAIATGAFKNNAVIQSVVIPDAVEEIPAEAFSGCANLASVTLPYKLRRIDESAFNYCDSLAEIHFPGTPEEADTWLDFMPAVTLHVFRDQGWPEVVEDDGTYFGLVVVIGANSTLRLELGYDSGELPCEGGEAAVTVSATAAWTAESNADWLVLGVTHGARNGVVTFTCAPNPTDAPRTATISVRLTAAGLSKSIDVVQEPGHSFTDTLEYVLRDGKAIVLDYLVDGEPVVIPTVLDGHPVAEVRLTAHEREGFRFREWSAVGIELADAHAAVVRFAMPAHNVILVSAYNALKTYSLAAGWNIVTPTLVLTEASAQELAGLGALTWNAGVENYVPAQGAFAPGVPLWLFCREAGMLTLEGVPPEAWSLKVAKGWSLVGVVRDTARNKWPANLKAVWRWTPRGFEACDGALEAGQAYWMQGE